MTKEIYNKIWEQIVQGDVDPEINNLALKIKINFIRMQLRSNKIGIQQAINDLDSYCRLNESMLKEDLIKIEKLNLK